MLWQEEEEVRQVVQEMVREAMKGLWNTLEREGIQSVVSILPVVVLYKPEKDEIARVESLSRKLFFRVEVR